MENNLSKFKDLNENEDLSQSMQSDAFDNQDRIKKLRADMILCTNEDDP